jgi:hypothetical protein
LLDEKSPNLQIPIRLHWYEWNNDLRMPGKELTDSNIIVYPYKSGWNDFELPDKTIEFPKGLDRVWDLNLFIRRNMLSNIKPYTTMMKKLKWLNDISHRWSLSMQYVDNEDEGAFYILNNADLAQYSKKV